MAIFDGKVKLPEDYFREGAVLPIKYGRGHPVDRHPVSDVMDPSDVNKVLKPISCLTCHQPHSSAKPDLLVKDQANNMAFCTTCHTKFGEVGVEAEVQNDHESDEVGVNFRFAAIPRAAVLLSLADPAHSMPEEEEERHCRAEGAQHSR